MGPTSSSAVCFAAGTKLLSTAGPKPIENFRVGDDILSRSEVDPNGVPEVKLVEEVFVQTGKIVDLHVNGQVIRTTAEHPFWVDGKFWVDAKDLLIGDLLLGDDGQRVTVEEVYDTANGKQCITCGLRIITPTSSAIVTGDSAFGHIIRATTMARISSRLRL